MGRLRERGTAAWRADARVQQLRAELAAAEEPGRRRLAEVLAAHEAVSKALDVAYLRAASLLLDHFQTGQWPPLRWPRGMRPPGGRPLPSWVRSVHARDARIWRYLPVTVPGDDGAGGADDHANLRYAVARAARTLRASELAHRLGPGEDQREQTRDDLAAVWQRARAYGDAVVALLAHDAQLLTAG
ncbi:hypothetical protein AQ490_15585 [Wenjunlia vitaminophila]|uniref:Uncharacterized protein n=1 Tax=Wenjunlia vitaminophila TaxID=76728 RepID=A0A0T6LWR4_WENVI|nr:hypothetical protein AQ490_15585 [Wenjunlia vitaminophila]